MVFSHAILGGIFIKKLCVLLLVVALTACNNKTNNQTEAPKTSVTISKEKQLKDGFTEEDKQNLNKYLGDVKDNVYTNEVIGFSLTLDPDTKYSTVDEKIDIVINDYFLDQDYYKSLLDEKASKEKESQPTNTEQTTTDPEQTDTANNSEKDPETKPIIKMDYSEAESKYGQPFDITKVKYLPLLTFDLTKEEKPTKVSINAEGITKPKEEANALKPEHFYKIVKLGLESTKNGLPVESELQVDELAETTLGGITFNRIDSRLIIKEPSITLNQVLYFKILDNYILTMQATYKDGELESIEKILNTVKFSQ